MAASSATIIRTLTLANNDHFPAVVKEVIADFTPSTSYGASGEAMTPALFGLSQVDNVTPLPPVDGSRVVTFDGANKTLRIFSAIGTEVTGASDPSTKVIRVTVTGSYTKTSD